MERREIEKILKKELKKDRFIHTQGVMYTAAALAMAYGADMERALYAGLLHDCAKCFTDFKQLELCRDYQLPVSVSEEHCPFLLHAKLGAYLARTRFEVQDSRILHAIQVHTTGEPDMNTLDKILYIADYIEPNRSQAPHLPQVRKLAFQDLDLAMEKILSDTLKYLEEKGGEIDPLTLKTHIWFRNKSLMNKQK